MFFGQLNKNWFSNARTDVLSGMTVALALIPEAIAFSLVAQVSPMAGLYASITMAIVIAFAGGRPGMISAATGAIALLVTGLVKEHGVEYLFAAAVLAGVFQIILGSLKLGRFITFVPRPVMTGFVNALAILIFMSQLTHFKGQGWIMYALVALTLVIIYVVPKLTKAVPPALAAIVVVSVLTIAFHLDVYKVGDMGALSRDLPTFHLPDIPLTWEAFLIILPYSVSMAFVGLLESLMTAMLIDDITDTASDKNREMRGQGMAQIVTGFFGGMGGCAMIGQSMINIKSGGRTRLSTLVAGVFLLILLVLFGDIVKQIPMAALVGVMIVVCIGTFDWKSVSGLRKIPLPDAIVMVVTVIIVVATDNLSIGVAAGVLLSSVVFAWKMAIVKLHSTIKNDGSKVYTVSGPMFFGTMHHFMSEFHVAEDPERIIIDFSKTHIWDQSAVNGIARVIEKYEQNGKKVMIQGLNEESRALLERIGLAAPEGH
ncbi:SulP family inorganic anion transporter [Paenibacillus caui]|uniref:SulP family inorganic anion transporter n=1 Tax=Paenibacillus caui TaxID=2873927 RepID=UPI001CA7E70C|nr:SulP family inorganic anion transporter [Paenibacillus caui]